MIVSAIQLRLRFLWDHYVAHALDRWRRGRVTLFSSLSPSFPLLMTGPFYVQVDLKIPRGCLTVPGGHTAPFMTVINVILSVILARAATFAHTSDRCWSAWAACSKISVIKAVSSTHLVCSGNFLKNSSPDGISSGGPPPQCPRPLNVDINTRLSDL